MSPPEQSQAPLPELEPGDASGSKSHAVPDTMSNQSDEAVSSSRDCSVNSTKSSDRSAAIPSRPETDLPDTSSPHPVALPSAEPSAVSEAAAGESKGKGKEVDTTAALGDAPDLTASTATLKPSKPRETDETRTQHLTAEPLNYVDPTPPTPTASQPPSRSPSTAARSQHGDDDPPSGPEAEPDEKKYVSDDEHEGGSRLEIQSIMDQFSESGGGPGAEEVMSPRLEIASPMLGSPSVQHPPRKSSLEPLSASVTSQMADLRMTPSHGSLLPEPSASSEEAPPVPPKDGSFGTPPKTRDERAGSLESPSIASMSIHRPPPPEPEPEPALPFDFHRFLEQLRHKKADPVARYLKSFLSEFGKKQWMVHEQVKIISDFLAFIANKMMQCEVWRDVSDAEFDNAREGMEKLVMNRLYSQTFSPAIPPPKPVPGAKPKRKGGDVPLGPGRKGQHQEDVERDNIVQQKINIYGWIREEHLDMPPIGDSGKRFLRLAQQELLKIKSYRAPRDKIICVLNCCKVIFGLLKHNKSDSSADSFMPLLIYVVLQSNPEHLVSNVQYILRFRNQEKLGGEAGYYLSSLMGAVQFIENLDRTTLTISDEEFEKNVEAAVSAIAEKHQAASPVPSQPPTFNEKSSLQPPELPKRPSMEVAAGADSSSSTPGRRSTSSNDPELNDEKPAIGTLLRTIQKPLSTIGRMFSEDGPSSEAQLQHRPSPLDLEESDHHHRPSSRHNLSAEEAAARQASAEAAEAQKLQRAEHANVVETLAGMFPDLDKDIISDVVYQKEGRVGLAVDACLALSA